MLKNTKSYDKFIKKSKNCDVNYIDNHSINWVIIKIWWYNHPKLSHWKCQTKYLKEF